MCGGGVRLSLWHLSSATLITTLTPTTPTLSSSASESGGGGGGDDETTTTTTTKSTPIPAHHEQVHRCVEMVDGQILAGGHPPNPYASGGGGATASLERYNYAGRHVLSLDMRAHQLAAGINCISTTTMASGGGGGIGGKSTTTTQVWTLLGGESSELVYVADFGMIAGALNTLGAAAAAAREI